MLVHPLFLCPLGLTSCPPRSLFNPCDRNMRSTPWHMPTFGVSDETDKCWVGTVGIKQWRKTTFFVFFSHRGSTARHPLRIWKLCDISEMSIKYDRPYFHWQSHSKTDLFPWQLVHLLSLSLIEGYLAFYGHYARKSSLLYGISGEATVQIFTEELENDPLTFWPLKRCIMPPGASLCR